MPKIITAGNNWQTVGVPGEFTNDANFEYLSAFEELVYRQPKTTSESKITIKKKKKNQKLLKKNIPVKCSVLGESKKKKLKKKKQKLKENLENNEIEKESSLETALSNIDRDIGTTQKKGKKRTAKRIKRKGSKKVRFSFEEPEKEIYPETDTTTDDKFSKNEDATTSSIIDGSEVDLSLWHDFFLPDEIMQALKDLRFSAPTEIQSLVLPSAVRDKLDILGAAETGSGKTLAFVIPLVCRLLEIEASETKTGPKALILAPTRELVVQIKMQLDSLLKYTRFKGIALVGGLSQQKQERLLKHCPDVIVATPGRFWAISEAAIPDSYLSDWSQLQVVVVDETDRMVEKGHFDELEHILNRIKNEAPEKHQTLVFSATLTFAHLPPKRLDAQQSGINSNDKLKNLINVMGLRAERKVFDITNSFCTPETLMEARMNCADLLEKDASVLYLVTRYPGRTLIFANSVDAARRLHGILNKVMPKRTILMLHARMEQKRRLKNLEAFSGNENSILLATDVAARGLDIPGVRNVIHYQISRTAESYIHRSGRTARISQRGLTVVIVDPQDVKYYLRICRNLAREKDFPIFPVDRLDLMKALKDRLKAASELESLEHRISKITSRENWFKKAAREAEILDDRGEEREVMDSELLDLRRQKNLAESKLKMVLAQDLPNFDRQLNLNTRYITSELVSDYEKEATKDALLSLEENEFKQEKLKKKIPHLFGTRQILKLKNKKKKFKRW